MIFQPFQPFYVGKSNFNHKKKNKPDQTEQFVRETYLGHCQTSLGKVFGE